MQQKKMRVFSDDPYLKNYQDAIIGRHEYYRLRVKRLLGSKRKLSGFANGHLYFGLHRTADGSWLFREWLPNAQRVYLIGDFSGWQGQDCFALRRINSHGDWELTLPAGAIRHGQLYRMKVYWDGGCGERLPAYTLRAVQDPQTHQFSAQVWCPEKAYRFQCTDFTPSKEPLLIYECHIGMATTEERVGTYNEFRQHVLPRVARLGYNAIQLMAIQEHPYYGSFGYHVSNFFAPSSRFGTPEELMQLVDEAHKLGIAVIMDLVHSHVVKNTDEGLGMLCGDSTQYFHAGARGYHPAWDSLCFNYGSDDVLHFLLSNCKYWLQHFHFDGFRFDGVTSMMYLNHGLGQDFMSYSDYYNLNQDGDAICYLTMANQLIHELNPRAITIAEEMSGMPGLASPIRQCGIGFDYRLAMGIPDYWIRIVKDKPQQEWNPEEMYWTLLNHRAEEQTISYVESHDQALVGDKTLIFRLVDSDMYGHFRKGDETPRVIRGIALHKMITLITLATASGGYLNFMGNEFGHPEWIDFPREGNGWSYQYACRRWDLVDREDLWYADLNDWNGRMIHLLNAIPEFYKDAPRLILSNPGDQVLAFERADSLFVFNFSTRSYRGYRIPCRAMQYRLELSNQPAGATTTNCPMSNASTIDCSTATDNTFLYLNLPPNAVLVYRCNL